jgi:TolB-like protein/DNA-binding winged helix-turn-helix (wHTH) protein/Flp pilus assembly protein TadD
MERVLPPRKDLELALDAKLAMHSNEPAVRFLRFGIFQADVQTGELTKQGRRVRLQEQPFRLLIVLLEKPGEVVTREELHSTLWPQTTVDFDHGLNKAISKIREALGDSSEHPRFVETVARRGYRFLADVAVIRDGGVKTVPNDPANEISSVFSPAVGMTYRKVKSRNVTRLLLGFALTLAAASLSWVFYAKTYSSSAIHSLAVLPLENLSGDASQNYFADGMTDALIIRLAKISALRVISRTSTMTYKNVRKPLNEIARELNVDAVVEGSVSRSGDRVRVAAELIDARDDKQIWSESYDEDIRDTLALQSKITRAIAERIRAVVNPQEQLTLTKSRTVDPDAYEAYLKGRFFWSKRTGEGLRTAIEYFKRAIVIDPVYPEAYSGLADSYAVAGDWKYGIIPPREAFPLATAAAAKALELDNSLGEAHASLAFALDLYGWDWDAADAEFKQAIKFSPGYATAHQWYSWHLFILGRNADAMSELKTAQSLDPLSLIINADIADALCVAHRFDEAVEQSEKTLKMDANFATGHYELGQALTQKHMYDRAIAEFRKAIELSGHSGAYDSNLGYAYALSGRKDEAVKIINDLDSRHSQNPSVDADIALIYMGLGDREEAMVRLNEACEARFKASILLRPIFDPLRSDPGFRDLLRRIGLPTPESNNAERDPRPVGVK